MEKRIFDGVLQRLSVIEEKLLANDKEGTLTQLHLLRGYLEGVRDSQVRPAPAAVFNR